MSITLRRDPVCSCPITDYGGLRLDANELWLHKKKKKRASSLLISHKAFQDSGQIRRCSNGDHQKRNPVHADVNTSKIKILQRRAADTRSKHPSGALSQKVPQKKVPHKRPTKNKQIGCCFECARGHQDPSPIAHCEIRIAWWIRPK
jgi:hypothetical protein